MKSLYAFLFVALIATSGLKAQALIGLGGGVYFSSRTSSDKSVKVPLVTGINFSPKVGAFIIDKLALGVGFEWGKTQYKYAKTDYAEQSITKVKSWSVAPFVRYYFADVNKFSFLLEGSISYGGSKTTTKVGDNDETDGKKYSLSGVYLVPAFSYNINNRVSLEMTMGNIRYSTSEDQTTEVKTSGFYLDLGFDNIIGRLIFKVGNNSKSQKTNLDKFN
jgi:hypothetical protein